MHEQVKSEVAVKNKEFWVVDISRSQNGQLHTHTHKGNNVRILGANNQFHNSVARFRPSGDLIGQIIKGHSVSKGEEEEDGIHLLLTGLRCTGKGNYIIFVHMNHQNIVPFFLMLLCLFSVLGEACDTSSIPEANGQIGVRRSLHSPIAASGKTEHDRSPSTSQANIPLWSQCLQEQLLLEKRPVAHVNLTHNIQVLCQMFTAALGLPVVS